jgi:hypothetical protein
MRAAHRQDCDVVRASAPLINADSPEQLQKLIDQARDELRGDNAPQT